MKLSIGEVSKIFNISKETLRYYDKIGILKPEVNSQNGYRYYLFKHLEKLSLILGIKLLGISLADIKDTIESEDLNKYKDLVLKQEEILQVKKKELEHLEYNLNESKKVLDIVTSFQNEYNFDNLEISDKNYTLYALDIKKLLSSNISPIDTLSLEKELSYLNEEINDTYIYLYTIVENNSVREDENVLFIKENSRNINLLEKYLNKEYLDSLKLRMYGKYVSVNFYGTVKEINEYILSLNKYFNCPKNNSAYVTYEFYLPKKTDDVTYFVNISLNVSR
ncbi:MerR family DNA-binding transcriptional regulator [Romboutsia lituseburensis]|uniref:MerR family DNA-binding transcriptional regulator n=1 Tax=Romboutsia lituseburensis TaxID=1537 RepID=UPI00215B1837|nr:MerR family transcriptional regulator [Romboutsia lituseburensis]MCR8746236.1 MerR family transcriptional regulator [Romboutsia lituseburensis]